jgi:hypothetical protein
MYLMSMTKLCEMLAVWTLVRSAAFNDALTPDQALNQIRLYFANT